MSGWRIAAGIFLLLVSASSIYSALREVTRYRRRPSRLFAVAMLAASIVAVITALAGIWVLDH